MKKIFFVLPVFLLLVSFTYSISVKKEAGAIAAEKFEFTIDGKKFSFSNEDISTSYRDFGNGQHEFKIYGGEGYGKLGLTLTVIADMNKPSSTPNGDPKPAHPLFQGSVSLQNYPEKSFTFNNYDGFQNPKPTPVEGAILITSSSAEAGGKARIISGTINTVVLGGENKSNDPTIKDYAVKGTFTVRHKFTDGAF